MSSSVHRRRRRRLPRDERGQSLSVFVVVVVLGLVLVVGLVVDGGQQARATTRAESVAAGAARAAGNAVAGAQVAQSPVGAEPVRAARAYLAGVDDVQGSVTVTDGRVQVSTRSTRPTIFLSLIGIGTVSGSGSATADVVAVGGR